MGANDLAIFTVDVEVSNRCNAGCDFCPRDRTPHEGTMRPDVFERAFRRVTDFREIATRHFDAEVRLSFCGLGEATLNRDLASYVRTAVAEGFEPSMCTNGSLLTAALSEALIDAGMRRVYVNCGDLGDAYDRVYKVSFDRLRDNVTRFMALAGDRADIYIVLVDHHADPDEILRVRRYWEDAGVRHFFESPMLNRSGTLEVEGMDYASYPQHLRARSILDSFDDATVCAAAFAYPFIGYDGQYYLCSSDWEKKTPMGSVFDESLFSVLGRKLAHVSGREPICRTCCHDPLNRITDLLRRLDDGDPDAENLKMFTAMYRAKTASVQEFMDRSIELGLVGATPAPGPVPSRRRIPVTAV